jgi:dTDP-4-dehydrorhamnose 3,5-epimerase-like enzyme
MRTASIYNCNVIELPKVHNRAGNITSINNLQEIPFEIKRIYYSYDIPGGEGRGGHAHKNLEQLIIAATGSFDITLDDGKSKKTIMLNRPNFGLHIVPGMWRDISNFSSGSICLVLASSVYDPNDYIRTYPDFLEFKRQSQ